MMETTQPDASPSLKLRLDLDMQPVQRSDLWDELEHKKEKDTDLEDCRSALDEMLKARMEWSLFVPKSPLQKKKKGKGLKKDDDMHEFRVFEGETKMISLAPPLAVEGRRLDRPAEDTLVEAERRQSHAKEIAVDGSDILAFGGLSQSYSQPKSELHKVFKAGTASSNLAILEITKIGHETGSTPLEGQRIRGFDGCPLIPIFETSDAVQKSRRRKRKPIDKKPAAFFKPLAEWGGKSRGYGMGWEGSWADTTVQPRKYPRDKMRHGISDNKYV